MFSFYVRENIKENMTANSSYPVNNIIIYVHFSQKAILPIIVENGNKYYKFLENCSEVTWAGYLLFYYLLVLKGIMKLELDVTANHFFPREENLKEQNSSLLFEADSWLRQNLNLPRHL